MKRLHRVLLAFACSASASADDAVSDIAETFRAKCQSCHSIPDPERELDRAWLGQIERTA